MAVHRLTWHDAYDAQMGTWSFTRTDPGAAWVIRQFETSSEGLRPDSRRMLADLYRTEASRLFSADPIFVSSEMCQLIEHAQEDFRPEPLYVSDLITPTGFVYYEKPFDVPDRWDVPTQIKAISWAPVLTKRGTEDEQLAGLPVVERSEVLRILSEREQNRPDDIAGDGVAISLYREPHEGSSWPTPLLLLHVTPWWFGMTFDGNETDENGKPTGAGWWWKIIQVTLRLMQQRIAVQHHERPPRAQRRNAGRIGWRPDQDVLVVRLRREYDRSHHEETGESANYSHRFIVGGHWRNQRYGSAGNHTYRQIYISDFIKGPEHLPLVIKPKRAYTWDR